MGSDALLHQLETESDILRQRGGNYHADMLDAARGEIDRLRLGNNQLRAEIRRLRIRLGEAELIGAAVRINPTGQPKHRRVRITWRDGTDWHWYLLLGFEPGGHLRLQGIDDPDDGTPFKGAAMIVHWDQIESMEER